MKKIIVILILVFVESCSVVVESNKDDSSIFFIESDRILITTYNSSQQIKITKKWYSGDTLIITYKRGFCSSKNILPLKESTKFFKCANKLYKVNKSQNVYKMIEINNK